MISQYDVFRKQPKTKNLEFVGINQYTRIVRCKDSTDTYYDIPLKSSMYQYIPTLSRNDTSNFYIVVEYKDDKNLDLAVVNVPDSKIGDSDVRTGSKAGVEFRDAFATEPIDNSSLAAIYGQGINPTYFSVTSPIPTETSKNYKNLTKNADGDTQEETEWRANADGLSGGAGTCTVRGGGAGLYMSNNTSLIFGERFATVTQEQKPSLLFCTNLNFMQHYFIGLANAVALPMPHMIDTIEMARLGNLVKTVMGPAKESLNFIKNKGA